MFNPASVGAKVQIYFLIIFRILKVDPATGTVIPDCFPSDICLECQDDYLSAVLNITHKTCHDTRCPHKYTLNTDTKKSF